LWRQIIDLTTYHISIIWAGEQGKDDGGLMREFLLYSMKNLPILSTHLFGKKYESFFTAFPIAVMENQYFFLGQLCSLSIMHIGRGPECFHPILVNYLFGKTNLYSDLSTYSFEGELEFKISNVKSGNNEPLLDADIMPVKNQETNVFVYMNYFCIISKAAAINQFKSGVRSIIPDIFEKACCFERFFLNNKPILTLEEVRRCLKFERSEKGSNTYELEDKAIVEFEMFLMQLSRSGSDIDLSHFLRFVAAVDRIPFQGFSKPIEVYFTNERRYPTASTCGLYITIPVNVTIEMLITAMSEGITFSML